MNPLAEQAAYFIPIISSEHRTTQDTEDHRLELALGQLGIRMLPRHPAMALGHAAWGDHQQQFDVYMDVLEAGVSRARWVIMNFGPDQQSKADEWRVARELAAIQHANWARQARQEPDIPVLVLVNRSRRYDPTQVQLAHALKDYDSVIEYDLAEDLAPRVAAWLQAHQ